MPEVGEQIAALPMKWDDKDNLRVLMVTSRDTGRWVMPKGWEMDGKKPWAAAKIEALEEAGAKGYIGEECIGTYRYPKIMDDGRIVPCVVRVYPMIVEKLLRDWKERGQRRRKWFSPKAASKRVDEPDLAQLLVGLARKPHKQPIIRNLLDNTAQG
ncbi:NUDIX hydrolase [Thalassococcus sp. CAU 1522]|uniref:NUDIX hydrolase n=1 Tax=Thalassococcus arenae TaxID=2851652 RepID=A0ABS6N7A0_9RHOB|nr:NUDIX hydrolase [Thalassococcus arenae]MBV2359896.1 NUDIX hydrolase [Thalassococcus arenae]